MLLGLNGKGCCEDLYWASGFNRHKILLIF